MKLHRVVKCIVSADYGILNMTTVFRWKHNYVHAKEEVILIMSLNKYIIHITYLSKSALSKCCLNTYRQWFGHSDVDGAVTGGLEDVHGIIQAGSLQVSLVNEHESVTGQQATISVGHTSGHQGPDDQHCLSGVLWILPSERSGGLDKCFSTGRVSGPTFISLS